MDTYTTRNHATFILRSIFLSTTYIGRFLPQCSLLWVERHTANDRLEIHRLSPFAFCNCARCTIVPTGRLGPRLGLMTTGARVHQWKSCPL